MSGERMGDEISVFTFPFGIPLLSSSKFGEVPEGRRGL